MSDGMKVFGTTPLEGGVKTFTFTARQQLAVALAVGLIVGYFAGREHLKYELRATMQGALDRIGQTFNNLPPAEPKGAETPSHGMVERIDNVNSDLHYPTVWVTEKFTTASFKDKESALHAVWLQIHGNKNEVEPRATGQRRELRVLPKLILRDNVSGKHIGFYNNLDGLVAD